MKPYYVIGLAKEVQIIVSESQSSDIGSENFKTGEKKFLNHALEKEIDGVVYVIVPLSEICELLKMKLSDFLEDEMLDALNTMKHRRGFPVIINV